MREYSTNDWWITRTQTNVRRCRANFPTKRTWIRLCVMVGSTDKGLFTASWYTWNHIKNVHQKKSTDRSCRSRTLASWTPTLNCPSFFIKEHLQTPSKATVSRPPKAGTTKSSGQPTTETISVETISLGISARVSSGLTDDPLRLKASPPILKSPKLAPLPYHEWECQLEVQEWT